MRGATRPKIARRDAIFDHTAFGRVIRRRREIGLEYVSALKSESQFGVDGSGREDRIFDFWKADE